MVGVTTDVDYYNRLVGAPREDVSYVIGCGRNSPLPKQAFDVLKCLHDVFGNAPMTEVDIAFAMVVAVEQGLLQTQLSEPWGIFRNYRQRFLDNQFIRTVREEKEEA